ELRTVRRMVSVLTCGPAIWSELDGWRAKSRLDRFLSTAWWLRIPGFPSAASSVPDMGGNFRSSGFVNLLTSRPSGSGRPHSDPLTYLPMHSGISGSFDPEVTQKFSEPHRVSFHLQYLVLL